jgi:hypothetical protein
MIYGVDVQTLVEIGFTSNQAKLYLTLLKFGKLNVRNISHHSKVPRQRGVQGTRRTAGNGLD